MSLQPLFHGPHEHMTTIATSSTAAHVYVTTDRDYARFYAAGYPRGGLYRVDAIGELTERREHDPVPSWGCQSARVAAVIDPLVYLSQKRIRSLLRRWMS